MTWAAFKIQRDGAMVPYVQCPECGRAFDLTNEDDSLDLAYGHDCEVTE